MVADRQRRIERAKKWKFDTIATHGLYDLTQALQLNSGSIMEPVYMSTAQAYENSYHMEAGLSYQMPNWCYSRIANPSTYFLEETAALLEVYGTDLASSCVATASGMSAIRTATEPFLIKDDSLPLINIVTSAKVYGGTFQQFSVRRGQEQGIDIRWVINPTDMDEWASKIDGGTRFVYGEFPSNPSVDIFDIEAVAELAHINGIPLIVDSTCASPALTRPLAFGADIVVQSATKVMAASGTTIVGLLIARHNIISKVGSDEMKADFATWVKFWPFRDNGPGLHAMGAIMTLNDIRTLRPRIAQMSHTALTVSKFLEAHPKVDRVFYPGLTSYPAYDLAKKYMRLVDSDENHYGYMLMVEIKEAHAGENTNTRKFYDGLDMVWRATDLGRVKTVACMNAISTHQQQGEEGRTLASIKPNAVRVAVGVEHPDDIIVDLEQGLSQI
ncbi:MAG: O-acetylhomoserine aminocarboxypropyltransferase/cysteine synthase [Candidatus Marinimicrobia bacterium]|nr:O-acetylhomoserine aminocarboxypropyltransferase/cysteine synthase [Candidatus Neomarinimicrobiota bacterium]